MRKISKYWVLILGLLLIIACDPIEDDSLRNKHFDNKGEPISKKELQAMISVTQPIPNTDDDIKGDQYVVIKNAKPQIGGVWHIGTSIGTEVSTTDHDTIVYTSNGTYGICFEVMSAFQLVRTDTFYVSVSNCFDEWETILTGAQDKTDKAAKKTWEFWPGPSGLVYYNGMYGNWKYDITVDAMHKGQNNWDGGGTNIEKAGAYTMVFEFDNNKLITYKPDGSILGSGNYSFLHSAPEIGLKGQLITTTPLIGSTTSWAGLGASNSFWILQIDEETMVVVHPDPSWNSGGEDWDYSAWYGFYRVKK